MFGFSKQIFVPASTKVFKYILLQNLQPLRVLDSIHNSAICLATVTFHSNPVVCLFPESGEPPLPVRGQIIFQLLFCPEIKVRKVPAHNLVFRHTLMEENNLKPNAPACFAERAGIVLADLDI